MSRNLIDSVKKELYNVRSSLRFPPEAELVRTHIVKAGSSRGPHNVIPGPLEGQHKYVVRVTLSAALTTNNIVRVTISSDDERTLFLAAGDEATAQTYDFTRRAIEVGSSGLNMFLYLGNTTGGWWATEVETFEWWD
jgi:hypothetical protein